MLKSERKYRIMEILRQAQFATISELSRQTGTSPSTVRRDLNELLKEKLIERNRSGVTLPAEDHTEAAIHFRSAINSRSKLLIAQKAVELVENGTTIFLDSSSTVLNMVKELSQKKVTVVTHSLSVLEKLSGSNLDLFLIGGEYFPPSRAFFGASAVQTVKGFNFDYTFISCNTVTPDGYATATHAHSAVLRRNILERTKQAVLLVDQSKIGSFRPYNIAHVNQMQYVVTDFPGAFSGYRTKVISVEDRRL